LVWIDFFFSLQIGASFSMEPSSGALFSEVRNGGKVSNPFTVEGALVSASNLKLSKEPHLKLNHFLQKIASSISSASTPCSMPHYQQLSEESSQNFAAAYLLASEGLLVDSFASPTVLIHFLHSIMSIELQVDSFAKLAAVLANQGQSNTG
jgi:glutaminase